MQAILTIIFLTLLFCLVIRYSLRNKAISMTFGEIAAAFSFKVLLGCVYGYLFWKYYAGDDTWVLHEEGITDLDELLHTSKGFFADLRPGPETEPIHGPAAMAMLHLRLTEHWLLRKLLALCNVFSRGNYYINVVFFNVLVFWAHYLLFRLLATVLPQKRTLLLILVFFFPPAVFWLSGIRGDGLLFLCVSLTLWNTYRWLYMHQKMAVVYALLALAGVLVFRIEAALLLLPALLCWWIVVRFNRSLLSTFGIVYISCTLLFFASLLVSTNQSLPGLAVKRQQDFMGLKGNTRLPLDSLQPSVASFIRILPQAAGNTMIRPFPWEAKGALQIMAVLENCLLLLLLALAVVRPARNTPLLRQHPLGWVLLFFGLSAYLVVGYIVPFPGAIVRYKIIPEVFLLVLLATSIRFTLRADLLSAR